MKLGFQIQKQRFGWGVEASKDIVDRESDVLSIIFDVDCNVKLVSGRRYLPCRDYYGPLPVIDEISENEFTVETIPSSSVLVRINFGSQLPALEKVRSIHREGQVQAAQLN